MLKKLTDDKLEEILEVGIMEFADKGPDGANINVIAKKAGISVGVLYKASMCWNQYCVKL